MASALGPGAAQSGSLCMCWELSQKHFELEKHGQDGEY